MAGRNQKTNFDFFRLNTGFFSNKKIKALRRQFGSVGVLTYLYILSYAYGNDGYYIRIDSVEDFSYDIAESIANSNLTQVASVATDCINYLASRGEINKHLLDKGVISGESIQRQYIEMCKAAQRKVEIKEEYRLVDTLEYPVEKNPISSEEIPISSEEIPKNSEEMQQNKIKENIEVSKKVSKKEKENNITPCACAHARESYDELFESFGVSAALKCALMDFIKHLLANGIVMINSRLEQIIIKLDRYFPDDADKIEEVQKAINGGYKKLSIE